MNKELEEKLKQIFLEWQENENNAGAFWNNGSLTYLEYITKLTDIAQTAGGQMFTAIHSMSDWS